MPSPSWLPELETYLASVDRTEVGPRRGSRCFCNRGSWLSPGLSARARALDSHPPQAGGPQASDVTSFTARWRFGPVVRGYIHEISLGVARYAREADWILDDSGTKEVKSR